MKKKRIFGLLLLLFTGVVSVCIGSSYAKYTSSISKGGSVAVAKWNFETDNNNQIFNIDLKDNYDESTIISTREVNGKTYKLIAPGTEGSFDIDLINTSEVGANFTISLDKLENFPTNIKFYKDADYKTELIPESGKITGTLKANDSEGITVKIYWKWIYETGSITNGEYSGDELDNSYGINGDLLTIPVTIKGVQVRPGTDVITSHIN